MILNKPYEKQEHIDFVAYANNHNMVIEDKGEYLECVEVVIPLEEVKATKIAELKLARDTEELSPISFGGYLWDFDEKAQMRINGAIVALGSTNTVTWTSADNQEIKGVNADDLKGVVGASAIRSNTLHIKYRDLKALVESATSQAEVESIVW